MNYLGITSLIIVSLLVAFRIFAFIKEIKTSTFKNKLLLLSLLFLIPTLIFSFLYKNTELSKNKTNIDLYYDSYSHFIHEDITKYYSPLKEDIVSFLGVWQKSEEIIYSVKETPTGFIKMDVLENSTTTILNDSTIQIADNINDNKAFLNFDNLNRLREITYNDETHLYRYDSQRCSEYIHFIDSVVVSRHYITYKNNVSIIRIFDENNILKLERKIQFNYDGLPVQEKLKRIYTEQEGNQEVTYYDETQLSVYEYEDGFQIEKRESLIDDSGTYLKMKNHRVILAEYTNINGALDKIAYYKSLYDNEGNWVAIATYSNGAIINIALREITYRNGTKSGTIDSGILSELKF